MKISERIDALMATGISMGEAIATGPVSEVNGICWSVVHDHDSQMMDTITEVIAALRDGPRVRQEAQYKMTLSGRGRDSQSSKAIVQIGVYRDGVQQDTTGNL